MLEAIAITIAAIAVALYVMCITAPIGYEDDRGQHAGEPPESAKPDDK